MTTGTRTRAGSDPKSRRRTGKLTGDPAQVSAQPNCQAASGARFLVPVALVEKRLVDYKDIIAELHDELCYEFEEEKGRAPNQKEYMDLYVLAEEKYQNRMADLGDYLRKREMGE